jgi:serine/threonine protein kinase
MDIEIDPQAQTVIFRGEGQAEHHYHRGDVIGGSYQLLDLIGQGGMGVVYRVKHLILEKQFALKLLAPNQINNQNWRRFELEGRSLAKLNHTNIVSISNMGIDKGCPYFVMDLLTGISLAEQIKNSGPLSEKENLDIYLQVCAGLSCAHRNGITHRDIKPANIMLLPSEKGFLVKIVDFGLVRLQSTGSATSQALTASGEVFGSPYYMSPEQTLGEEIDARSDIYSLGCSLFESLTGQVPFAGASAIQTLMMHQEAEAPIPSKAMLSGHTSLGHTSSGHAPSSEVANRKLSQAFDEVVARCLQKDAKLRYQSADQLAIDLQRILDGKPIGSGALDYQHLKRNGEPAKTRTDHFEDDEDVDDNPANEKNQSSNFFSAHKLALGLASLASIILVAAAGVALTNKAGPPTQQQIMKDTTHFSLEIDDDTAIKMNDAIRSQKLDITRAVQSNSPEIVDDPVLLVAVQKQREQGDQSQIKLIDNAPKFSLGIKKIDGRSMRCFKFPSELSIGKVRFEKRHVEAQGEMQVPADEVIDLHLRPVSAQCPSLIDKFDPEDISTLRVENSNAVGEITRRLSKWTKIHALTIEGGKIIDEELANFDNIKGLDFLWLKRLSFNAEIFAKLQVLKRLDTLQIEDCKQLNQILQNLPVLPKLKFLRIEARGNDWLESKSITALARQPNLKILELKSKAEELDSYSPSEGFASTRQTSPKLPIYDWRNQLAELKNLQVLVLQKPEWKREQIVEFLQLVPAARQNLWAQEYGYHPNSRPIPTTR